MARLLVTVIAIGIGLVGTARADEVLFINGDRLTGTIVQAVGGKVTIKTETAGVVTADLSKVKTFSTTAPVQLHLGDKTVLNTRVAPGPDGTVTATLPGAPGPVTVVIKDVVKINPPPARWTGSVTANGMMTRGNSSTETVGISASASRRTEQDRMTFGAGYQFGRQKDPDTGEKDTTTDYLFVLGKYDYFFTPKLYGYAGAKVERDKIADLDLRFTPGVGVGYQWFEEPTLNFFTEAGIAWIYEDFRTTGSDSEIGGRLAYHVDWRPLGALLLFHNLEWLPAFSAPLSDFLVNGDAGARVTLIGNFFAELKGEFRHDNTPAEGRQQNDWRGLLGVGLSF